MRKKAIKSILLEKVLLQEGRFKGTEEETKMYCEEVEEEKNTRYEKHKTVETHKLIRLEECEACENTEV